MAYRMSTATRMDRARANGKISRIENGTRKRKERASRDARIIALIKTGTFPYIPSVMCWISTQLGKKAASVTEAEAKSLVK